MKKMLHYTACGLDNVWLENGFTVKETKFGKAFSVNDAENLHRLISLQLIGKKGRLTGKEFRFLRVQLGLTQEGLGKLLDASENAVSLWERKDTVPATCDQWLRLCLMSKYAGNTKISDAIEQVQTVQKLVHQKYVVKGFEGKRTVSVVKMHASAKKALPA